MESSDDISDPKVYFAMRVRSCKLKAKKRVRWAQGHSSDSNPKTIRYRSLAKAHLRASYAGHGVESILLAASGHNEEQKSTVSSVDAVLPINVEEDSAESIASVESALTEFTSCTNATFSRIHRHWKSGSAIQKDILAVLASVTEYIRNNGGKETEVEYFAALLATLSSDAMDIPGQLAATLYLLTLVIRRVPQRVLRVKFGEVVQVLVPLLGQCSVSDSQRSATRYLIATLGSLLQAQDDAVWQASSTRTILDGLLQFALTEKPRLRKSAQKAVVGILSRVGKVAAPSEATEGEQGGTEREEEVLPHPASRVVYQFCSRYLENTSIDASRDDSIFRSRQYALNLLASALPFFNTSDMKSSCEMLLSLLGQSQSNHLLRLGSLGAMYGLLIRRPPKSMLSLQACGQLILALLELKPSATDGQFVSLWCSTVRAALVVMADRDPLLALRSIPRASGAFIELLQGCHHDTVGSISKDFASVLTECCDAVNWDAGDSLSESNLAALSDCLQSMEGLLSYQLVGVWPSVLRLISLFFSKVGYRLEKLSSFPVLLKSLVGLRESDTIASKSDLDHVIGSAIKWAGPEAVLKICPLGIDPSSGAMIVDFPRSWLLPLLRENIGPSARLGYFIDVIMPLAVRLHQRIQQMRLEEVPSEVSVRVMGAIEEQLWGLLPGFCRRPCDLVDNFPRIARALGTALLERADLRLLLLSALRTSILSLDSNDSAARSVLEKYCKNYLPILFNLYTTDIDSSGNLHPVGYDVKGVHLSILETIRVFVGLASPELVQTYLEVAQRKLTAETRSMDATIDPNTTPKAIKHSVLDILIAMVPKLSEAQAVSVLDTIEPFFVDTSDRTITKKAYRFLEDVCHWGAPEVESDAASSPMRCFLRSNFGHVKKILALDSAKLPPSTKRCRMNSLRHLLGLLSPEDEGFVQSLVPSVIDCIREQSTSAKRAAARCVIDICSLLAKWYEDDVNAGMELLVMWMSSLFTDKEDRTRAGCLVACRLLIFEFRSDVSPVVLSVILGHVTTLLADTHRAVVQSCIELLITFVSAYAEVTVGQFLDGFLPPVFQLEPDCQRHFRFLIRKLLIKLTKRFGFDSIKDLVPDDHHRQLRNVRKLVARSARRREEKNAGRQFLDDESSVVTGLTMVSGISGVTSKVESIADLLADSDSEADSAGDEEETGLAKSVRSSRKSKRLPVWLDEGLNDDIVDLLDSKGASRVSATDPNRSRVRAERRIRGDQNRGFKVGDHGKLIIGDEDDDSDNEATAQVDADSDSEVEDIKSMVSGSKRRKRLHSSASGPESAKKLRAAGSNSQMGYKPGGLGIHRARSDVHSVDSGEPQAHGGHRYRSEKAKGDVRRGTMEPYAYVPLRMEQLNRRKRKKLEGSFKHLVKGARKGATKGSRKGARKGSKRSIRQKL